MTNDKGLLRLDLTLFDGGGAGAGAAAGEAASGSSSGPAAGDGSTPPERQGSGKRPPPAAAEGGAKEKDTGGPPPEDKNAAFEKLIRGEFKEQFSARTQAIIDRRFREAKQLEARLNEAAPILESLSRRYGVEDGDLRGLSAALEAEAAGKDAPEKGAAGEDPLTQAEAAQRGLTPEQFRQLRRMTQENEALRRTMLERERRADADRTYAGWLRQAEEVRSLYPAFDLRAECRNPRFIGLLRGNVDVRTAYEVIHRDEILGGAMGYAARRAAEKLVGSIRAKGMRPAENGVTSQSAAVFKPDVGALTREERDDIERRVQRGERIHF